MKHEIRIFFTALMFYTRLPCPKWIDHKEEYLNEATKYFPFIGWIIGIASGVFFILFQYLFNNSIAVVLSMVASVFMTGAFHEDGFADTCDGFGGGWTKEKILLIMKDSRLGTYGVIGLISILSVKFLSLLSLADLFVIDISLFILIIVSSHSLSRLFASTYIYTHIYVRLSEESKVNQVANDIKVTHLVTGAFFGLIPFAILVLISGKFWTVCALLPLILFRQYFGGYFKKWIGGYTGDCLGASQQLFEVIFYLSILVIWRFI